MRKLFYKLSLIVPMSHRTSLLSLALGSSSHFEGAAPVLLMSSRSNSPHSFNYAIKWIDSF